MLVRERARGSKLQGTFAKKSGKTPKGTAHTITMLPENSSKLRAYAKRVVAALTKRQKAVIEKITKEKRQRDKPSSSDSSQERPTHKKSKKNKKKAAMTKGSTPDVAFEFDDEEERRPPVVEISSSTDGEIATNNISWAKADKDEKEGTEQNPVQSKIPIAATAKWEVEKKPQPPTRVIERNRVATKKYGIDFVQVETESDN